MPAFDYDTLLWGERQIRSVANMTRQDARDFLQLAAEIGIKPQVQIFPLDHANEALQAVKNETANGPVRHPPLTPHPPSPHPPSRASLDRSLTERMIHIHARPIADVTTINSAQINER